MNITGLYRVQVSEKYRFLPQRFNNLEFHNESIGTVPAVSRKYASDTEKGTKDRTKALNIDTTGPGIELLLKLQLEKLAYPCVGN